MFAKDTVTIPPVGGTGGDPIDIACGANELATGITARTSGASPDVLNTVNSVVCTNWQTGENRSSDLWAGKTNSGTVTKLTCPAGSYISAVKSNWRGWDNSSGVTSGIGIVCKNFDGKVTLDQSAGKEVYYPISCPTGYYVNAFNLRGGNVVDSVAATCVNMNPRINVIKGGAAAVACCMGTGDASICNEFSPQSGQCDALMSKRCASNPNDELCGCFSVPAGIPPCYASKCLNGGYMLKNMVSSCPNTYVNCDAQVIASNTGTQLSTKYGVQQNCGTTGTTTSTTPPPVDVPSASFNANGLILMLIIFIVIGALFASGAFSGFKNSLGNRITK